MDMLSYPRLYIATDASNRMRTIPGDLGPIDAPIRDCVLEKGITHCGKCDIFPCDLMERHLATIETVVAKAREVLTPEEFRDFVEPYLIRGLPHSD